VEAIILFILPRKGRGIGDTSSKDSGKGEYKKKHPKGKRGKQTPLRRINKRGGKYSELVKNCKKKGGEEKRCERKT